MGDVHLKFSASAFCTLIIVEVSLILFVFTGSELNWSDIFRNIHPTCDVLNSSVIRKLVEKNWNPVLNRYGVSLPIECPLNLSRDMLGVREVLKQRSSSHWKCKKCGKRFYLEKYLDLHIEKRHSNIIRKADDSVCLGNYCDVMRCDILKTLPNSHDDFTSTDVSVWTPSAHQPHQHHSRSDLGKIGGRGQRNVKGQEQKADQSLPPPSNQRTKRPELQIQSECDEEYFALLRSKCSQIIWECIQGLISILDAQEFKTIQDELESSSCSYLSCSRPNETQCSQYSKLKGMRPFLVVFGSLVISLCLALAYYFAWIYTQSTTDDQPSISPRTNSSKSANRNYYEENLQQRNTQLKEWERNWNLKSNQLQSSP